MIRAIVLCVAALFAASVEAKIPRSREAIAEFKRLYPCPGNGNRYGPCPGWQIDHVQPLKCKGEDRYQNMQWLTVEDHKEKTKREAMLCRRAQDNYRRDPPVPNTPAE